MPEPLIDIVATPDHPAGWWWQAIEPGGSVAGVAGLLPGVAELTLYVRPEWRRRGIGARLLAAVRERTAEPRLVVEVAAGSVGEAFGRRHGFRHTGPGRRELLAYGDVHQAWLGELVDAERPGYRLTHRTGDLTGEPHVEDLLRPSGPGDAVLTAAAADGDLAAYAAAVVDPESRSRARQYGPVLLPPHRGWRLALWVNAALVQRLREVHPQVAEIEAGAAEGDRDLLAAREQLGFRPTLRYELLS